MAMIKVNINNVRNLNSTLHMYIKDIQQLENEMKLFKNDIEQSILFRERIEMRIININNKLSRLETELNDLYDVINSSMDEYSKTEFYLCQQWSKFNI
ncbi:MAG: hypothetical protein K2M73_06965 [Lachnospiraceae bacterium]|nr:hypothetical protein [Lachnospiraceae bacterium]